MALLLTILLTLVELNCENLFDWHHDDGKDDTEYTPDGTRRWSRSRYWQKLTNLAQEIASCGTTEASGNLPDLVALCEVENDSCMLALTRRSLLRTAGYEYIMTDSPDTRGIDVALMYMPASFRPLCYDVLPVATSRKERPTRDILYVKGLTADMDTLHVLVCHLPSRYGGGTARDRLRRQAAAVATRCVDSLLQRNALSRIIVTGDMNESCHETAPALLRSHGMTCVTDTCRGLHGAHASYCYQGLWQNIDHVMLSKALLPKLVHARINDAPFLLEEDTKYYGMKPRRTFYGIQYRSDGYSDHLPLVITLRLP